MYYLNYITGEVFCSQECLNKSRKHKLSDIIPITPDELSGSSYDRICGHCKNTLSIDSNRRLHYPER